LRHAAIVAMLHVPRLLIAVNKMDLVHFEESTFNSICEDMQRKVASLALPKVDFVPVAARTGANVVRADESLSWFKGPTVLEFLESIEPRRQTGSLVRFPVQLAFRPDGTFRGFAGSLSAGRLSLGDEVHASRADRTSRVVGILGPDGPRDHCEAGEPVVLELADAIDGGRGELFVAPESRAHRTFRFTTNLCVMSPQGLRPGSRVLLRHLTREEPAEVDRILSRFDTEGLTPRETSRLELNDLGIASLRVATPIFADLFQDCPATGAVVLLAADTFEVVAAGTILSIENSGPESPPAGHGRVVWLTGLSGAGKTTLAEGLREDLRALGVASVILDGDALRAGVNRDLGFSEEARTENVRRTAEIARLLAEQGVWVLCSLISPLRSQRHFARELLAPYFIEVYVRCSLETATKRDPKGLYRRAYAGEIRSFTGISSPYEAPEAPDVLIDTEAESVTAARTRLLDAMRVRLLG
jgi:bifunctional enzyme CysN/CysC